jgi:hypothetical protein
MVPTSKGYVVIMAYVQLTEHLLDGREIQSSLLKRGYITSSCWKKFVFNPWDFFS